MDSYSLRKMLEKEGWVLDRVKGSHHQFKHPEKPGVITIPHPRKDIPKGTVHSILKQAGLKK